MPPHLPSQASTLLLRAGCGARSVEAVHHAPPVCEHAPNTTAAHAAGIINCTRPPPSCCSLLTGAAQPRTAPVQVSLRLEAMQLTDAEAGILAAWAARTVALLEIRKLWLFDNRLTDDGATALAPLLAGRLLEVRDRFHKRCLSFEHWVCQRRQLHEQTCRLRMAIRRTCQPSRGEISFAAPWAMPTQVHLSHNMIGRAGAEALLARCRHHQSAMQATTAQKRHSRAHRQDLARVGACGCDWNGIRSRSTR